MVNIRSILSSTMLCATFVVASDSPSKTIDSPIYLKSPGATPKYSAPSVAAILPIASVVPYYKAVDCLGNSPLAQAASQHQQRKRNPSLVRPNSLKRRQVVPAADNTANAFTMTSTPPAPSSTSIPNTSAPSTPSAAAPSAGTSAPAPAASQPSSPSTSSTTNNAQGVVAPPHTATSCLDSTNTDSQINSLFSYGGANTTVYLCPSARIVLSGAIAFTSAYQTIVTQGLPTDSTRAMLVVNGASQATAIIGNCDACSFISILNIIIDGSRPTLGQIPVAGGALIEIGGSTLNQVVDNVRAYEPRGWSTIHAAEGGALDCAGIRISNNVFGPAGHGPSGSAQERRRDTGTHTTGEWADGISFACTQGLVANNTIIDATDGGLVIFQAPGSTITNNTIVSNTRVTMGGINMVDYNPFSGNYSGTVVSRNNIISNTSMIKVGIAMGPMTWGSNNDSSIRTTGGFVTNNTFSSGPSGYFSYGISIAGHNNATVTGSKFVSANFGGLPSSSCPIATPPVGPFIAYPSTNAFPSLQPGFSAAVIMFVICNEPSPITIANYTS